MYIANETTHDYTGTDNQTDSTLAYDEYGYYIELEVSDEMAPAILEECQYLEEGEIATIRVYISDKVKRTVVVKEDDLLTPKEIKDNEKQVAKATLTEITTWLENACFEMCLLHDAQNTMTSRYVCKWKWVFVNGHWIRIIRMRLVLRGFMDTEAFSLETYSGTAKRTSQKILASEAACHPNFIIASLDIDKAFLKGFTYKELAEATGEKERVVCFKLPPGSAAILRTIKGFEHYDESKHCLRNTKPGTGTKDAPRAFSMKLRQTTKHLGLKSTSYDQ